jgi:hypothetical protein
MIIVEVDYLNSDQSNRVKRVTVPDFFNDWTEEVRMTTLAMLIGKVHKIKKYKIIEQRNT